MKEFPFFKVICTLMILSDQIKDDSTLVINGLISRIDRIFNSATIIASRQANLIFFVA
jgi:hypothetical protein